MKLCLGLMVATTSKVRTGDGWRTGETGMVAGGCVTAKDAGLTVEGLATGGTGVEAPDLQTLRQF